HVGDGDRRPRRELLRHRAGRDGHPDEPDHHRADQPAIHRDPPLAGKARNRRRAAQRRAGSNCFGSIFGFSLYFPSCVVVHTRPPTFSMKRCGHVSPSAALKSSNQSWCSTSARPAVGSGGSDGGAGGGTAPGDCPLGTTTAAVVVKVTIGGAIQLTTTGRCVAASTARVAV